MAQVHIKASERVHYSQTVTVPDKDVHALEGMSCEDLIERYIDRHDVIDATDAEVADTRIVSTP